MCGLGFLARVGSRSEGCSSATFLGFPSQTLGRGCDSHFTVQCADAAFVLVTGILSCLSGIVFFGCPVLGTQLCPSSPGTTEVPTSPCPCYSGVGCTCAGVHLRVGDGPIEMVKQVWASDQ